jgi:Zn-dependent protease with chaperone function
MVATMDFYPPGPASVPPDLTRPSGAYRRHGYLALAGLFAFLGLYFALAGWFAWTAWRLLSTLPVAANPFFQGIGGVCAGFLAVFMFKAVMFVRRGKHTGDLELSPAEHPQLFAFLHRLADEAGAPRPHRVYLSPQVNAAVFFDLSIANLIIPSRKNLEIGLGLINVLTLAELKAVLAHEFGHFAQRTMAVGRWVYIAQQIAGHIVVRRDGLDRFLQRLSAVDLRIAWLGWLLRLIVWSIRSLVDTVFSWVVIAQRALSREMELQADLVAVSLTGSDALVHALHRLDAADDAMDRAVGFAGAERAAGRAVADLFAVQTRMLARKREILGDPGHGLVPALPAAPEGHRLFKAKLAHPPRMWATHPPNEVRENNAKRVYVPAPLDDRSGWVLFQYPQKVRERVTATMYKGGDGTPPAPVPMAETLASFDEKFDRRYFDPAYHGAYLGRSVVRDARTVDELYGELPAPAEIPAALEALYPSSLSTDLEQLRELGEEKVMLEALQRGILEMPGGIVQCRGRNVRRRELPALLAEIDRDLAARRKAVAGHDRRVRTAHRAAARALSPQWEAHLRGLLAVLHYADHREADVDDAVGALDNVFTIITADRKVTASEIDRLVGEAMTLHAVLEEIFDQAGEVRLGPALAERLGSDRWDTALGTMNLPAPSPQIIGEWMDAAHSWAMGAGGALSALSTAALDELLRAEEEVALHARSGQPPREAPPPPLVPLRYSVLVPGQERERQTRLGWWDRFQVADGFVPAVARLAVAGSMVALVLWAGRSTGEAREAYPSEPMAAYAGDTTEDPLDPAHRPDLMEPFLHLQRGDLAAAIGAANGTDVETQVLILSAGSDGAPPHLVNRALGVPVDQIAGVGAIYTAAIALRAGRDPAPYLARIGEPGDAVAEQVRAFVGALGLPDPAPAAARLDGLDPELRAIALSAAVVATGDRGPPEWRRLAIDALVPGQRPYFRELDGTLPVPVGDPSDQTP